MRKQFTDLNKDNLWELRKEIVLNSLFISDYKNTFGFSANSMCSFFDGYMDYLEELAKEDGKTNLTISELTDAYDSADNLFDYYWGCDDYSWVEYDPVWTKEEMEEYEKYWNNEK